jgi:hypothetical protein
MKWAPLDTVFNYDLMDEEPFFLHQIFDSKV